MKRFILERKLLVFLLVLSISLSLSTPALASSTNLQILISPVGHGEYRLANMWSRSTNAQLAIQSQDIPELYQSGSQNFLLVNEHTLQAVQVKDLSNCSLQDVSFLNLPEEVFSSIKCDFEKNGYINGSVLIPATTSTNEPAYYTHTYRGNNYYMQVYTYVTELIRTPPEEILSGPDTSKKIDSAISLGLTVGGEIVDNLGQFTTAASVLKDMFVLLGLPTNTTITRSTSDLVELKIWYSKNEKYTYVNNSPSGDGNYIIGAVTGKGLIDELVFDMYFYNGGNAYEIYEFVLKNYNGLRFSPAIETVIKEQTKNPKKLQREIHKSMSAKGIGTKSQQALQLQHEQCKQQRKAKSREEKVAEEKRLFELKQQKKKEKHRGR